jgi:hypothetical protein
VTVRLSELPYWKQILFRQGEILLEQAVLGINFWALRMPSAFLRPFCPPVFAFPHPQPLSHSELQRTLSSHTSLNICRKLSIISFHLSVVFSGHVNTAISTLRLQILADYAPSVRVWFSLSQHLHSFSLEDFKNRTFLRCLMLHRSLAGIFIEKPFNSTFKFYEQLVSSYFTETRMHSTTLTFPSATGTQCNYVPASTPSNVEQHLR